MVRGRLVLADSALEDRPRGQVREAPGQEGAGQAEVVGIGQALAVRGVEAGPDAVDANLEAAVVRGRDAVAAAGIVRPGGEGLGPESPVALRGTQVEHGLAGHRHELAADVGEQLGQPGSRGEDESLRAPAAAGLVDDVDEAPPGGSPRPNAGQGVRPAGPLEGGDGGLDPAAGPQEAGLGLEEAEGDAEGSTAGRGGERRGQALGRIPRPRSARFRSPPTRRAAANQEPGGPEAGGSPTLLEAEPVGRARRTTA